MQIIIKYFQLQDLQFFSKNKSGMGLEPRSVISGFIVEYARLKGICSIQSLMLRKLQQQTVKQ